MDNSIKDLIKCSLEKGCGKLEKIGISLSSLPPIFISQPKKKEWGDLSTNLPFLLQKESGEDISKIGNLLVSHLQNEDFLSQVEFVSPGFINLFIAPSYLNQTVKRIVIQKEKFIQFSFGNGKKVQVEFVSANPTGPLHVGHGRAAALGDSLANILSNVGYKIEREYYINDVGGQIKRLARSVWVRLQEIEGIKVPFPDDGYKGLYLIDIAKEVRDSLGEKLKHEKSEQKLLDLLGKFTVEHILKGIKKDLDEFGVRFDRWFRESSLYENGEIPRVISFIKDKGYVYEKDGALWFIAGKREGRVFIRSDGSYTYIVPDIAYHRYKFDRGYDVLIDLLGPDHIDHIPELEKSLELLGYPVENLLVKIIQWVTLKRGAEKIKMSKRSGEFITIDELLDEVGVDAARYLFLMRKSSMPMDFDLELAKEQSERNPVYYVQYGHARISSLLEFAREKNYITDSPEKLNLLRRDEEWKLIRKITEFKEALEDAAKMKEPHLLCYYLLDLSKFYHNFYQKVRIIGGKEELIQPRLFLSNAIRNVLAKGLSLLGVSTPERM